MDLFWTREAYVENPHLAIITRTLQAFCMGFVMPFMASIFRLSITHKWVIYLLYLVGFFVFLITDYLHLRLSITVVILYVSFCWFGISLGLKSIEKLYRSR